MVRTAGPTCALSDNLWRQVTPLEQLLSPCGTAHSHLSHHVAWDVACLAATFPPIEAISIFVPKHLEAKTSCLRRPVGLASCTPRP